MAQRVRSGTQESSLGSQAFLPKGLRAWYGRENTYVHDTQRQTQHTNQQQHDQRNTAVALQRSSQTEAVALMTIRLKLASSLATRELLAEATTTKHSSQAGSIGYYSTAIRISSMTTVTNTSLSSSIGRTPAPDPAPPGHRHRNICLPQSRRPSAFGVNLLQAVCHGGIVTISGCLGLTVRHGRQTSMIKGSSTHHTSTRKDNLGLACLPSYRLVHPAITSQGAASTFL